MASGPVVAMVWEGALQRPPNADCPVSKSRLAGKDVVKTGRVMLGKIRQMMCRTVLTKSVLGATNPLASAPGTIRGDFAIDVGRNICHGSDSVESAQKEMYVDLNHLFGRHVH